MSKNALNITHVFTIRYMLYLVSLLRLIQTVRSEKTAFYRTWLAYEDVDTSSLRDYPQLYGNNFQVVSLPQNALEGETQHLITYNAAGRVRKDRKSPSTWYVQGDSVNTN